MGFSFGKVFNEVSKFVFHPSAALNKFGLDIADKGLRGFGLDLFGNKQQDFNNQIAKENNALQKEEQHLKRYVNTKVLHW